MLATVVSELWDAQALPLRQRWMEPREPRRCTLSASTSTSASLNVWPPAMHPERVDEHERIVERLATGDAQGARDTMQYHINQVARRFARG